MAPTDLTVIIPTLNAESTLDRLLVSLKAQDYPIKETIIVDSGSADKTLSIAGTHKTTILKVESGEFNHGTTRNYAAENANSSTLIFMTQDAIPLNSKLIENLLKPLADPQVALAYARQIASPDSSPTEKFLRLSNYPATPVIKTAVDLPRLGIKTFFCSNACAAYNRKLFEALGGFPQPVPGNEDMLFAARAIKAGLKVAYAADALVEHTHTYKATALFKRYFDISASLDNEPQIRTLGKAESNGFKFIKEQLTFLRKEKRLALIPKALVEAGFKYLGFKAGAYHRMMPVGLKKHLGLNTLYWSNLELD